MKKVTYKEYFEQLNDEAMYRMLSDMKEVPSLDDAQMASDSMLEIIKETCGLSKLKMRKAKFLIASVKFKSLNYLATLYFINDAKILLRATDLENNKFYIPNKVWVASTDRKTQNPELQLIMSLSE